MVDYIAVCLTGISTGLGVIISKELWDYFTRYRQHITKEIKRNIENHLEDRL